MPKIRILAFVDSKQIGGQELMVKDICQYFDRSRFDVLVTYFSNNEIRAAFEDVGVKCIQLGPALRIKRISDMPKSLATLLKLIAVIRREHIDVIQTNGITSHFLGSLAAALSGIRQVHIPGSLMRGRLYSKLLYSKILPFLRLDRFTSVYVSLLPGVEKELLAHGVPGDKIRTVIWGVDTIRFNPGIESQYIRTELRVSQKDILIGIVSRIVEDRGHEPLIRAVRNLFSENSGLCVKVIFAGDGPKRQDFAKLIDDLGLNQYFIFTGFRRDTEHIINEIDIAVLTPKDPIGSSFLREAMSCGKPVITTDGKSGAQRDWIQHNYNGLLIRPDDMVAQLQGALNYLLQNQAIAQEIGGNARVYIEKHMSLQKCIYKLERVFIDVSSQRINQTN